MPVCVHDDSSHHELLQSVIAPGRAAVEFRESSSACIDIGLINNMPDPALVATERQFFTLLDSASDGFVVRLSLYALPDVPRGDSGQRHTSDFYSRIQDLWNRHLDGLIVTGTEPRSSDLRKEPYWTSLTGLLDWAEHSTHSSVWSCLAAHAAVFHNDGIARRRLSQKRFGVFEHTRIADHPLTTGVPARLVMPHSRWNDLSGNELIAGGYSVITRTGDASVDMFVKQRKTLFVFFQGHPEYEARTLLSEYTRDIRRFLNRESDQYPAVPCGYFDAETAAALDALREQAVRNRREELLAEFPMDLAKRNLTNRWSSAATLIYRNWLAHLRAMKEQRLTSQPRKQTAPGQSPPSAIAR